jgi:nitrite reductase/ring-hydroxylating ferredoxin subunit
MFKINPQIIAHRSIMDKGTFVLPNYILSKKENKVKLLRRYCPHRQYPLHKPGDIIDSIQCNFHNFKWKIDGSPINNDRNLNCGEIEISKTGLISRNFNETENTWTSMLASEKNLKYSHSTYGISSGSWLWMMEIQCDLLHIYQGPNSIHPTFSKETNLDQVEMYEGDGYALQTTSTGWWLLIFPYTFIEWSPGCLAINYTIPKNNNEEFGFEWNTQFYYDPLITDDKKTNFETLEDVFLEDVAAIEQQNGPYYPLLKTENRLEKHCVTFGEWFLKNKK